MTRKESLENVKKDALLTLEFFYERQDGASPGVRKERDRAPTCVSVALWEKV